MKLNIIVSLLASLMLTGGCALEPSENTQPQPQTPVYQKITAEQAKEMMDNNESYILLDVRTGEEYAERRIDGAILIPHDEIAERAPSELPDKNALIFIYCLRGIRSEIAANQLVEMGYVNVYDLGGINDLSADVFTFAY